MSNINHNEIGSTIYRGGQEIGCIDNLLSQINFFGTCTLLQQFIYNHQSYLFCNMVMLL